MDKLYEQAIEQGQLVFHKQYCLYNDHQITARRWEIIDTETLDVKAAFSHREFTNGHTDYVVNHIRLEGKQLIIRGFKNA